MELMVFNKQFELQGIIDVFRSLRWRTEFYKVGESELHLTLPEDEGETLHILSLLMKDNLLVKSDSLEEAVVIEGAVIDEQDSETIVVTGSKLDGMIGDRFVWGEQKHTGTIEHVMKQFVVKNAISPTKSQRVIPNMVISPNRNISKAASEVNSWKDLGLLIEELALKYDIGWRVLFDLANKKYVFDVFEGKNRSINQDVNPRAIFSLEFENVHNQKYTENRSQLKTMALVAGQGEGAARKLVAINDNLSGFERKELFVDARDLSNKTQDDRVLTDAEYEKLLIERGNSKLAESQTIQTFESGISLHSNLVYKEDFELGDIVTIENKRWGLTLNTRITVVEEIYENDRVDIRVNFGSNIPTLLDKIQQKMG